MLTVTSSIEDKLRSEIFALDKKGVGQYLESSRKMRKEAELIETICKERAKEWMGDDDSLSLDGDFGVYVQYSPRYEVPLMQLEKIVGDQDLLNQITKVDFKTAEKILPSKIWLELKMARQMKGEPTKKLMVGKIKHYEG